MKIYCSCCDKVQPVRIDNCLDEKTNDPFQDIVCNECDLVIASGTGITVPPSLETAVGTAYKTGWEHGRAKEREACAKLIAAAPELYRTVTLQRQIIDKLLAMLIERDPNFCLTKSAVWPLLEEADAPRVLAKATGSQQ